MSVLWILGEAKSGKSEVGEAIFHLLPGRKYYLATLPRTPEHAEQIRKHEERRPKEWGLIEVTDDLSVATRALKREAPEGATVLLDGFAVYVEVRARQWERAHFQLTREGEAAFIEAVRHAYADLARRCAHLIVVDHVSADPPPAEEYAADPARWRLRAAATACRAEADHVIYHDREDVTHTDAEFVARMARAMLRE